MSRYFIQNINHAKKKVYRYAVRGSVTPIRLDHGSR